MDKNKKLFEKLLKADGINPAKTLESERIAFGKILDRQLETKESNRGKLFAWRMLTQSKIFRLSAAAVIIFAIFIGISRFGGYLDTTSVALADVAIKLNQIKSSIFKKMTTISSKNVINTFETLSYYTKGAVREDIYDNDKLSNQVYVNFSKGTFVGINYKEKFYRKTELIEDDIKNQSVTLGPHEIANFILSKGEYKKLGKKSINGIAVEGFEFYDLRTILSIDKDYVKDMTMRFWVDLNSKFIVRIEVDCLLINNNKVNIVMYDPQYDVELAPNFFEPQIPRDFIDYEKRGFVGLNLENWPTLKVVSGMPAEKAGIKDGDVLKKINGQDVSYIKTSEDARQALSGKAGDKIALTVKRQDSEYTFDIIRVTLPDKH
ncbi:MAG: PDZ domain-containing protein [Planctomycetaceae bacterium]|nr:PDZ domain-containing protein [Planctomycetaceae bacterium]